GWNQSFKRSGVVAGIRVVDFLKAAAAQEADLNVIVSGTGEQALVTAINGRKNGPGAGGRNWLYAVNGKLAAVGVGTQKIQPGDRVAFCYVTWKERGSCGTQSGK